MKAVSSTFKNNIKTIGKQIDSIISYSISGTDYELGNENLNSVSLHYEGNILKSVMKQLDIESLTDIPVGTIINYQFGVKVADNEVQDYRDNYEYIDYGSFIVYSSEKQEDSNSYKLVCYDKLLYSMKKYESLNITYPITIRNYLNAICNYLGLTFASINDDFVNYNKTIPNELYLGYDEATQSYIKDIGYTFRDTLDELAQVTASTICINDNDELEVRYINNTNEEIDAEYLKDINVNFGEIYGPINTISFKRSADSDVISVSYPSNLPDDQKNEISISDNQILNGNNRDEFIDGILNQLYGLTYYINDFTSTGITFLDLCDNYNVVIENDNTTSTYSCIMFNDEIEITQGLQENIHTDLPEESVTDYSKSDTTDRRINQTYLIVDKQNQVIESVVSQSTETTDQVTRLTQRVGQLESEISDVADLTVSGESSYAVIDLDNINESEPITITIHPLSESISYLYPRSNLYPSSTTYLKNRKVRFHNDTTNQNIDYILPNDLLYYDPNNYDTFELDYNEQTCIVTKKCEYDASGNVVLKTTPSTITYVYPYIQLTEGDYTISLPGYSNGYIFVRLMSKNIYTSQFYTKAETNSLISQTSQSIDLSVNTKLSNYSTTNEMNSAISLKANEITSSVNNTLTNYSTTTQMNSAINQKADEITSEVTEEVSENYETKTDATSKLNTSKNYTDTKSSALSSRISQTAKGISLTVNNGSTSSGISIGITKENGETTTTSGTIQMTGLVKFTDLSTSGSTSINGANIQTGTLSASKITSGSLSANRISGGTIDASTIDLGSGKFKVTTGGKVTATSGTIGGWTLSSSKLYGTYSGTQYSIRPYGVANDTAGTEQSWARIMSAASDKRLKHDIIKIDDKFEKFYDNLKPVSFYYNKKVLDDKKHFGFIAQDIIENEKEINEDLSMVELDDKYYNLYKEEIIALNTWQIQKLKEEVKLLKEEVETLKGIIKNGNM